MRSTQRIRTRGNVTVHKKGALLGTAFHCGSLVIEGSVVGSIYAQETVEFRTHAKVLGEIRCRHLLVEKRCHVQCIQPVHVQTLTLQGQLTARVLASGLVQIGRQGRLEGTLNAGRLSLEAGGLVDGAVMIAGRDDRGPASGRWIVKVDRGVFPFKIPSRRSAPGGSVVRIN